MDCREASVFMQLAEDGEIANEERAALDGHLSGCLSCRRVGAWLEALEGSYPTLDPIGEDFADAVVMQLRGELSEEIGRTDDEIERSLASPRLEKKRLWLGRIWSLVVRRERSRIELKKRTGRPWKWVSLRPLLGLGSYLGRSLFARGRKEVGPEKRPGWSSSVADSMTYGWRSLGPALSPVVAGPSYATGWIRVAGGNLRDKSRFKR